MPKEFVTFDGQGGTGMAEPIVFIDSEIGVSDHRILDLGAVREDGAKFHSPSVRDFSAFLAGAAFLCGHNILHHDLKYLCPLLDSKPSLGVVDTLLSSISPRNSCAPAPLRSCCCPGTWCALS